ncbi:MAG TPA: hypothetical protein VMW53_03335 [archaeon]|nr:hypothetical protein [archaeon]
MRHIHLHCHFSNSKQKYFIKFTQNIPLIYLREKIFAGEGEIKADTVHRHCKILNVNTIEILNDDITVKSDIFWVWVMFQTWPILALI